MERRQKDSFAPSPANHKTTKKQNRKKMDLVLEIFDEHVGLDRVYEALPGNLARDSFVSL